MVKSKLFVLCMIIAILFLITGCEKLTASLDGLGKETESVPEVAPETAEEQVNGDVLTGDVVAEVEEPETSESQNTSHTVKMTADGFSPVKLYIKVGDTVVWKNTRYGNINRAMIIGVRECSEVRSGFLESGESFSWTFDQAMTCTIADGIMTTKESKIFVE